jgi:hypothetical protein
MATTVRTICTDALYDLMVLGADENMSATDGAFALRKLNNLVDQWTSESLFLYSEVRTTWTIASGDGSYTVATGANVNVARPTFVDGVSFQDTTSDPMVEIPLVPLTDQAWAAIAIKDLESSLPGYYFYNETFPNATLNLYPVPTSSTLQGVLYARAQVGEFTSLDTVISLPPGWKRCLVANLAVDLAPGYGTDPSATVSKVAAESKATLKRSNIRPVDAVLDGGALIGGNRKHSSYYDFLTGNL